MAEQQQMSSFAKRLGARVAAANAEHRDKPIDTGNRRLPGGIRNGVAKLSAMYTKEQTEENGMVPKGESFFRASAIVMIPESHNGEKVAGMVTQVLVPMCDVPAKGLRKGTTFSENWFEFQNLFKLLGITPPNETPQTDSTGQKTEAYYFAAMRALVDPKHPVYIAFSTRAWTPPATAAQPKPNEMVFEEWHGLALPPSNGQPNPAAGVTELPPPAPTSYPAAPTTPVQQPFNEFAPPPQPVATSTDSNREQDIADLVAAALNDPEGVTEEGAFASSELEGRAWDNGWSKEQTAGAADWSAVGEMCLNPPTAQPAPATDPTVGSKWKFAKRTKDGARLKNNKGEEFPPQEVVVAAVNPTDNTCTVASAKDNKPVVDIRTKSPIAVKWEWLEPLS